MTAAKVKAFLDQIAALSALTTATVATSQTETSTSYDDLATVGPSVSVTVGASGIIEVSHSAQISNAGGNHAYQSFELSGANTAAAADSRAIYIASANVVGLSRTIGITGLTPGVTTVTCKYRVSANTGTFADRNLTVKTY